MSVDRIDAEIPEVSARSAGSVRRKDATVRERIVSREAKGTATGTGNMGVTVRETYVSREETGTVRDVSREETARETERDVFKEETGTVRDVSREETARETERDVFKEETVTERTVSREETVTGIVTAGRDAGPERGATAAAAIREAAAPASHHLP